MKNVTEPNTACTVCTRTCSNYCTYDIKLSVPFQQYYICREYNIVHLAELIFLNIICLNLYLNTVQAQNVLCTV